MIGTRGDGVVAVGGGGGLARAAGGRLARAGSVCAPVRVRLSLNRGRDAQQRREVTSPLQLDQRQFASADLSWRHR